MPSQLNHVDVRQVEKEDRFLDTELGGQGSIRYEPQTLDQTSNSGSLISQYKMYCLGTQSKVYNVMESTAKLKQETALLILHE